MRDNKITKAELSKEVKKLRKRLAELRQAEETLRESEEKWRSLLKNTPDIVMIVSRNGTIRFINHTIPGFTKKEATGKKIYDYISVEHHEAMKKDLGQIFQTGQSTSHEITGAGPHNTLSWYRAELGPIKQNGRIVAASIVTRDITEHKEADQSLEAAKEHAELIYRVVPSAIFAVDKERRITDWNNKAATITGYKTKEVLGKKCTTFALKPCCYKCGLYSDDVKKPIINKECTIKTKDGKILTALKNADFLKDTSGNIIGGIESFVDITEHKRAEQVLRESETRYRTLFQGAAEGIIVADVETMKFKYVNPALCTMLGYTEEELKLLGVLDIHRKEDHEYVISEFKAQAKGEKISSSNIPCLRKDGKIIYADINTARVNIDGTECNVGFFTDVTERKKTEDALRESEEKYRILVENQTDMVVKFDREGRLLFASPSYCKIFGKSQDALIGKKFMPLIHKEDREKVAEALSQVYKPPYTSYAEERALTKDGWRWQAWLNTAVLNNKKQVEAVVGVGRDITEQKDAEEKLLESEEKYRTLVESAGESIAMFDVKGKLLFINEKGAKQLGGKPKNLVGQTMWGLFPKKIADRQTGNVRKVIRTGKELKEISLTELQGRPFWYNTTIVPVKNNMGKVTSALIIARDITDQKQTEEELSLYRENMAHAEQLASLGTLSATLAHELNQSLTAIRLSIENSLADMETTPGPGSAIEDLKDALTGVSDADSIVKRLRNIARKSSRKIINEVNLKTVAERIVRLLNESTRRARVDLQLKGMEKLPIIYSNEKDLEQLFFSLIENAIQAADGKKNRRLIISGCVKDKRIELRFADTCGGIKPENLDMIFEPFFTTRPSGEGTGLGLCIVERIVTDAGGKIRVKSKTGKGSTFLVNLPINAGRRS